MMESLPEILSGVPLALQLVALALGLGFVLAVLLALARLSPWRALAGFAYGYVYVFRGTPLLVQMYLIYYGTGQFQAIKDSLAWVVLREPFWCAILALTLNTAAYTSEIIRGGLMSVPFGQIEAARAVGMSRLLQFRRIVFPIAIRQALPAYGNEVILMIKATSLTSTITLLEITGIARKIISATYKPLEIFIVAGAIYLIINFVVTRAVLHFEHRLSPDRRAAPDVGAAMVH